MAKEKQKVEKQTGEKVKEIRLAKGMTLKDLSNATGLSSSHLSQFERGVCLLSVASFEAVSKALATPLTYFFSTPKKSIDFFTRSYECKEVSTGETGYICNSLRNSASDNCLEPMIITLLPGSELDAGNLCGSETVVYVLEGILTVQSREGAYELNPGDSIHYKSGDVFVHTNCSKYTVRFVCVTSSQS
jgi:transcriptional regulator with XRE-family HTH domain